METGKSIDDLMADFLTEVEDTSRTTSQSADQQRYHIERLLGGEFLSGFEILQVSCNADSITIKKAYRNISLLIHPDKCIIDGADDAFRVLAKAFEDLQNEEYKAKYFLVYDRARDAVCQERRKENRRNKELKNGLYCKNEEVLMQGKDFDLDVMAKCEELLKNESELTEFTTNMRKKNEKRVAKLRKDRLKIGRKVDLDKRRWDQNRNKRMAGWHIFREDVHKCKGSHRRNIVKQERSDFARPPNSGADADTAFL